jgi:hypothetical protein
VLVEAEAVAATAEAPLNFAMLDFFDLNFLMLRWLHPSRRL